MIKFHKRLSTWANGLAVATSAAMIYIPDMGMTGPLTAKIMCACAVLVAATQFYKQKHD